MPRLWPNFRLFALLGALLALPAIGLPLHAADPAPITKLQPYTGFYTGSFDPPTVGHLTIIRKLAGSGVRKLVVLVNRSGEKDFKTSTGQRIAMLRSALADLGDQVEFLPVDQDVKNDLIDRMGKETGHPFSYSFVGEDSFDKVKLSEFDRPGRRWVMLPRAGDPAVAQKAERLGAEIFPIKAISDISSSRLREEIAAGRLDSPLMDPKVRPLIEPLDAYRELHPEVIARRQAEYLAAYRKEMRALEARFPALQPIALPPPPFLAVQSREAWHEKFVNWVVSQRQLGPADLQSLRDFAYGKVSLPGQSCVERYGALVH